MRIVIGSFLMAAALAACSDSAGPKAVATMPTGSAGEATTDPAAFESGVELRVAVPETGRVLVDLAQGAVVAAAGESARGASWDLAFEGFDVFTNSGPSGGGGGSAFGPLDDVMFLVDDAPTVPFLSPDKPGGAFLDWYAYEAAPAHALWSRYHVVGVKDGARLWKVQVITYYGERDGAPVSGLYKIRYAEVAREGVGPTREISGLDGTAGGPQALPSSPSECLDLGTGVRAMLTPDVARTSSDWHLCFRRQTVTVNGESGGRRGVGAVDLSADALAAETVADVKRRTAETERARFDAVDASSFEGKTFRGDRVVSGFGDAWIDRTRSPVAPTRAAWLVLDASGKQKFLVGFGAFENVTAKSPGTVVMRIKPVKG